jgi:hypothetical protein
MAGIIDTGLPTLQIDEIRSIRQLKNFFPADYDQKNNWLFCSTQGEHGTHLTIDDVEDMIHNQEDGKYWLTVLVVQPRLCNLYYGDIKVSLKDLPFLRQIVKNTLAAIPQTQRGNT